MVAQLQQAAVVQVELVDLVEMLVELVEAMMEMLAQVELILEAEAVLVEDPQIQVELVALE